MSSCCWDNSDTRCHRWHPRLGSMYQCHTRHTLSSWSCSHSCQQSRKGTSLHQTLLTRCHCGYSDISRANYFEFSRVNRNVAKEDNSITLTGHGLWGIYTRVYRQQHIFIMYRDATLHRLQVTKAQQYARMAGFAVLVRGRAHDDRVDIHIRQLHCSPAVGVRNHGDDLSYGGGVGRRCRPSKSSVADSVSRHRA